MPGRAKRSKRLLFEALALPGACQRLRHDALTHTMADWADRRHMEREWVVLGGDGAAAAAEGCGERGGACSAAAADASFDKPSAYGVGCGLGGAHGVAGPWQRKRT